ncbi:MAG: transaldolase family protein [Chloroflexota bacterium]
MMQPGYFHRVAELGNRLWINNPTGFEVGPAIIAGAVGCTTNPTYPLSLLEREPEYLNPLIDRAVRENRSDDAAAEWVYQRAVLRMRDQFLPLYQQSGGEAGYAIIQGDPRNDADPDYIIAEALRHQALGASVMVKLPANAAGATAIQELVPREVPICVTEVMGVAQAVYIWEAYRQAAVQSDRRPPFVVAFIAAPLDRYLAAYAQRESLDIAPETVAQASFLVAREGYRIFKARGYDGVLLVGGASTTNYFTEYVGGDMDVTMNWSEVKALLEADPPAQSRLLTPAPAALLAELTEKLPDFRRSYYEDALAPTDYPGYGPLNFFRQMFVDAYSRFVAAVAHRRQEMAT